MRERNSDAEEPANAEPQVQVTNDLDDAGNGEENWPVKAGKKKKRRKSRSSKKKRKPSGFEGFLFYSYLLLHLQTVVVMNLFDQEE